MSDFIPRTSADHLSSLTVSLAPHSSGRHLVHHLHPIEPFFYLGDTAWEVPHRLDDVEAETYLRNRAEKGFNVVMVVLLAEHGGLEFPNREGHWPFHPLSYSKEGSYQPDLTRPNPAYFAFIDRLIPLASSLGITLALVPTWGRYVNGGYYGSPILFDKTNAYSYARFLGERYPFHPWILGGDSNRYWNTKALETVQSGGDVNKLEVVDYGEVSEAMARGLIEGEAAAVQGLEKDVREKAEGYTPFITFHSAQPWLPSAPEASSSAQFPEATWLSLDIIQTGHHDGFPPSAPPPPPSASTNPSDESGGHAQAGAGGMPMWQARSSYIPVRKMYATEKPGCGYRPVMDLEAHYENTHYFFQADTPLWNARDIRKGGWQAIFAGACGYTYGCNSIWQMHNAESKTHPPIAPPTTASTNWYLELDLPGAFQASLIRRILLSLPNFFSRIPDSSFILSDTHEPSDGSPAGDKLVCGMRGDGWAMIQLPHGGGVEVDFSRALPGGGRWRAWWVDPRTGGREVFESGTERGTKRLVAPSECEGDDDWLLLLETYTP